MKRGFFLWLGLIGIVLVIGMAGWRWQTMRPVPVVINETAVPPVPTLNADHVAHGAILYAQYCAQCHGVHLEGAPDWKKPLAEGSFPPPPHDETGHTWHHPDVLLISIMMNGGDPAYNSKMPAFKDKLTGSDLLAVLEFIKSKWGKDQREYQWWMTATRDMP